jgi:hypothetical protein
MSSAPPEPAATPYDDVAYTSFPYPQSHPDHLASVAALLLTLLAPPPIGFGSRARTDSGHLDGAWASGVSTGLV